MAGSNNGAVSLCSRLWVIRGSAGRGSGAHAHGPLLSLGK